MSERNIGGRQGANRALAEASRRPRWLIRVCSHGHRVEYRENYGGWQHLDAPDTGVCDDASQPRVVRVVEDPQDPTRGEAA